MNQEEHNTGRKKNCNKVERNKGTSSWNGKQGTDSNTISIKWKM